MSEMELPDILSSVDNDNAAAYSMTKTVKYALFFQYSTIVSEFSKYVSNKLNDGMKLKLITDLRTQFFLLISAFGIQTFSQSSQKKIMSKTIVELSEGNDNLENLTIEELGLIVYEMSDFMNRHNITNVVYKQPNKLDAIGGIGK